MANYVILINWTEQGVASGKESLDRAGQAAAKLRKLGGRMKTVLWTIGPYDAVSIVEAPDDETVTAFCLAVGAEGNVRTTTLRAFDKAEMANIFSKL
ncbi:MAG: GYD domain-containing protein [Acidimicrobiia bacterium]